MIFRLTVVTAFIAIFFTDSFGQVAYPRFSLNLPASYTFDDQVNFDDASTDVKGAFQYGGTLEFFSSRTKSIELSYLRMGTTMPLYGPQGNQLNKDADEGSVNYILLGGNTYFMRGNVAKTSPFIGGGLGVGIMNTNGQSSTNFAFNFKGGIKLSTEKTFALKLHAYVQAITGTFGSDYWVSGSGAVIAVPDRATLFQFGLGGAICFDFRGK